VLEVLVLLAQHPLIEFFNRLESQDIWLVVGVTIVFAIGGIIVRAFNTRCSSCGKAFALEATENMREAKSVFSYPQFQMKCKYCGSVVWRNIYPKGSDD